MSIKKFLDIDSQIQKKKLDVKNMKPPVIGTALFDAKDL